MSRCTQALALLLLALAGAGAAGATPVIYTDRSSWDADVGGDIFLEDFDDFSADTSFRAGAVDVGPFSLVQGGGLVTATGVNLIDVSPFAFSGAEDVNGTPYVLGWANSTAVGVATSAFVEMVFDVPVAAWGADFANASNGADLWIFLVPSDAQGPSDWLSLCVGCNIDDGFFGFVDDETNLYSSVILAAVPFSNGTGERFGFDNVSGATVPEPSTALLFGLGLFGIAVAGRRTR